MALRRTSRGFTLIELVVVIFIIGIIATFAVLSIGGRSLDDQLQQEAQRAEAVIELAADEAQLKGLQIGLRYTVSGYEFIVLDEAHGRWMPYAQTGPLRARQWMRGVSVEMRMEGHVVQPSRDVPADLAADASADSDAAKAIKPQVMLFSSGEMTPFQLDLNMPRTTSYFRVSGDALGHLKLERVNIR